LDPLVSIAIPTFNRLHYLKEAVTSALAQIYNNVEIIIGDDGPTESIQAWSETIARRQPRVRYQRNQRRLGLAGNWNALADAARGEFIVIIGDDDRLLPDFVSRLVNAIKPAANVAFANHYLINSHGDRLEAESHQWTRHFRRDLLTAGEVTNAAAMVWRNSIAMSAALLRTRDVQRLRFKDDLNTPEVELFVRLANEGAHFVFVPDYLSEYRVHPRSATSEGLRGELLVKYLLPIPVPDDVEPYKREFMASLLVNSVSRCFQEGEWELARRFRRSEYYPRPRWQQLTLRDSILGQKPQGKGLERHPGGLPTALRYLLIGWVQGICATLPPFIGRPIYRSLGRIRSVFKRVLSDAPVPGLQMGRFNP